MREKKAYILPGLIILLVIVFVAGFYYSGKNYHEKIDRNGFVMKGVVYAKKSNRSIHYKYYYNSIAYRNKQYDYDGYDSLKIDDTIMIKVDTTNPQASYIIN
jgi:hypothetical protein